MTAFFAFCYLGEIPYYYYSNIIITPKYYYSNKSSVSIWNSVNSSILFISITFDLSGLKHVTSFTGYFVLCMDLVICRFSFLCICLRYCNNHNKNSSLSCKGKAQVFKYCLNLTQVSFTDSVQSQDVYNLNNVSTSQFRVLETKIIFKFQSYSKLHDGADDGV